MALLRFRILAAMAGRTALVLQRRLLGGRRQPLPTVETRGSIHSTPGKLRARTLALRGSGMRKLRPSQEAKIWTSEVSEQLCAARERVRQRDSRFSPDIPSKANVANC
jgi:hypothetical protein